MEKYKFKSRAQEEAEANEKKVLKEQTEQMKGKKLLKEATFTVTTVDDAIATIQQCMSLIAMKKRNILTFTDIIGSAIVSGSDSIAKVLTSDETKTDKISSVIKKKIAMIVRNSIGVI